MTISTIDLGGSNANTSGTSTALTLHSQEKDSVTYRLPSHSTKEPRLVIIKRTPPVVSPTNSGTAKFELKVVYGDKDSDSLPTGRNTICSMSASIPQTNTESEAKEAINVLQQLLMQVDITDDLVDYQTLPQPV